MMIGRSRVRASPRRPRAKARPETPGSIQSSSTRSGNAPRIVACALSASDTVCTVNPASSTMSIDALIDIRPRSFGDFGADLLRARVAYILAFDDVHDVLGDVLGV